MTDIDHAAPRRRLSVVTGILVLIALAILISLGTWQVQRLYWKQGLLADIAAREVSAPVPLADIDVDVAAGGKVKAVRLVPEGRDLPFTLEDGRVRFVVPKLVGHQMVEIAY